MKNQVDALIGNGSGDPLTTADIDDAIRTVFGGDRLWEDDGNARDGVILLQLTDAEYAAYLEDGCFEFSKKGWTITAQSDCR